MPALDGIDERNMEAIAATAAEADQQDNAIHAVTGVRPPRFGRSLRRLMAKSDSPPVTATRSLALR